MRKPVSVDIKAIYEIKEILPEENYIIISMDSKYSWMAEYSNVCLVHFADTEHEDHPDAISSMHIHRIKNFLDFKDGENGTLIIACDEGRSRSPALAAAILRIYGQEDDYIWKDTSKRPSWLVYKKVLEYYDQYESIDKLKDVLSRSPEIYRYYRKNDKDPVLEYDLVIKRNVGQKEIQYGFKYGNSMQILFMKVGGGGNIMGAGDRYLKAASYFQELYGSTVIVSSNPYDGSDSLGDAEEVIREYLRERGIAERDPDIRYFGYSDGARLALDYGHEHILFSSFILYNLPFEQQEAENTAMRLSEIKSRSKVTVAFGEEDESFTSAGMLLHRAAPGIKMHVIKGADHRLNTHLIIALMQLFFNSNALVANGIVDIMSVEKQKWMLEENLATIKNIYDGGKSYSDTELKHSLMVIYQDLAKLFSKYAKDPLSPLRSDSPIDKVIFEAYSEYREDTAAVLNDIMKKDHLEEEDLNNINEVLVNLSEKLTAVRIEMEKLME